MPRRQVALHVFPPFAKRVSRPWLRKTALAALDVAFPGRSCQLSLVIADDETLHRLNREYRGLDEVTDVLSFSLRHPGQWQGQSEPPVPKDGREPFPVPPGVAEPLGEVIISYPQAERQAQECEQPLERELALLVVHGILHLLGYDHAEPQEERAMRAQEQEALARAS